MTNEQPNDQLRAALERLDAARADEPTDAQLRRDGGLVWDFYWQRIDAACQALEAAARALVERQAEGTI